MSFPTFEEFFTALHGVPAYLWQVQAAHRLANGEALSDIVVPTGMGKTAIVEAWLWAYAYQRHQGGPRTVGTRLHLVIDRRDLVGHNAQSAQRLATSLRTATEGPVAAVADVLAQIDDRLLDVIELRGGLPTKAEYTTNPVRPTIVCATVDLLGSRLLWRGYGVSKSRRPIDAALIGIDSLIVLDEVHISAQFSRTLQMLDLQLRAESGFGSLPLRQIIRMSATPDAVGPAPLYMDAAAEELATLRLAGAFQHRSDITLTCHNVEPVAPEAKTAKAEDLARTQTRALVIDALIDAAKNAAGPAVLVMANTVAGALQVAQALGEDAVVLHGRMPAPVRQKALERISGLKTGAPRISERTYVVSTQTLEVGADLDFDSLVTQASGLDSLRQRAGRVNRIGARATGDIHIVRSAHDAVYRDSAERVFELAAQFATLGEFVTALPEDLSALLSPVDPVTTLDAPTFRDYLRTQGTLGEAAVGGWLRFVSDSATVSVVFRDPLNALPVGSAWSQYVALQRPAEWEAWVLPLHEVAKALQSIARKNPAFSFVHLAPSTDLRTEQAPVQQASAGENQAITPGSTLVLPAGSMKLAYDGFGEDYWPLRYRGESQSLLLSAHGGNGTVSGDLQVGAAVPDAEIEKYEEFSITNDEMDIVARLIVSVDPAVEDEPHRQELWKHSEEVADRARRWSTALGLDAQITETIATAGLYHDAGKMLEANQRMLSVREVEGQLVIEPSDELLAKSDLPRHLWSRARRIAGLPAGFRHEALSVALVDQVRPEGVDHELLRHLIGSHHGHGRGVFPTCDTMKTSDYEVRGIACSAANPLQTYGNEWTQWLDQFNALNERYGPYTLALAESLVRLADWEASEDA